MYCSEFDISKRNFLKKGLAFSAGTIFLSSPCVYAMNFFTDQTADLKLAMYQQETPRGIMCGICPNECTLNEGEVSVCKNRTVSKSKLYTMAFGNPCSVNIDPVEKKPFYHFLPASRAYSIATAGCNLACLNCQNWSISQIGPDMTRNFDMMPDKVVKESIISNCKSIAYTYTEPVTFYEYVYETAIMARKAGIKNIIKSNGYINTEPLKKLCTVIDAANIDLKTFNETTYLKLSGGKLQTVLESLKTYKESGVWLEITNLVIPGWTDNYDEIRKMCIWLRDNGFTDTPLHFSRFFPLHKLEQLPPTPIEVLNKAFLIAKEEGIKYVYIGNIPGAEGSDTLCPSCNALLIKRQGYNITLVNLSDGMCKKCGKEIEGVWN
jgi:pyruvate formate lyase activating enzyme